MPSSKPKALSLKDKLRADLNARYPTDLVDETLDAYMTAKRAALMNDLHKAETLFGQFCEGAIRICRHVVTGKYTPIGDPAFKVNVEANITTSHPIGKLEDEPFRILIPGTILAMYGIRNRRGVDHLSKIKPNHIDARVLIAQSDWILAELTRLATKHDFNQAQQLIDSLVERQVPIIEKIDGVWRLLRTDLSVDDAVLVALYHDDDLSQADLVGIVRRSQPTVSLAVTRLDEKALVHKAGRKITITSLGRMRVEVLPEIRQLTA
jgi:hypothetical protein